MVDKKKPGTETTKAKAPKADKAEAKTAAPREKAVVNKRRPMLPRTYLPKEGEMNQGWKIIDVANLPLGRVSSHIALILMGKTKASYTPFIDTGDHVIVINADKVKLTGKKWEQKMYYHHTGYPGGIKGISAQDLLVKEAEELVKKAVYRMLPKAKGHMARVWFKKLRVYTGTDHPHKAQMPEVVKLPNLGTWE